MAFTPASSQTPSVDDTSSWPTYLLHLQQIYPSPDGPHILPKLCSFVSGSRFAHEFRLAYQFPDPNRQNRVTTAYTRTHTNLSVHNFIVCQSFLKTPHTHLWYTSVVYLTKEWAVVYEPTFGAKVCVSMGVRLRDVLGLEVVAGLLLEKKWWDGKILLGGGGGGIGWMSEESCKRWVRDLVEFDAEGGDVVVWAKEEGYVEVEL